MRASIVLAALAPALAAAHGSTEAPAVPEKGTFRVPTPWRPFNDKVRLRIDANRYRSSSQGPVMEEELKELHGGMGEEIDAVIDRASRTDGWGPVIPQYSGSAGWAWSQWKGTIIQHLARSALLSMLGPLLLMGAIHTLNRGGPIETGVGFFSTPNPEHYLIAPLIAIAHGWNYLLTLTTFVTTFFVGYSHTFWRQCYMLTRVVQGRFNDLGMMAGSHAARDDDGHLTHDSAALLRDLARNIRLCHMLFWSDVCYRRTVDHGASFRTLLSRAGLDRLLERGLISRHEHATLLACDLPPSRWHMVVIEWIAGRITAGRRSGLLHGDTGFESQVLRTCCELRGASMGIPDEVAARMPLAYVHFTHLLVDMLLLIAPFALYPRLGAFSIFLTGVMNLFYRGLLELSKSFLDPYGNRRVSSTSLSTDIGVDTLLGETNAGSLVWPRGARLVPFDQQGRSIHGRDASSAVEHAQVQGRMDQQARPPAGSPAGPLPAAGAASSVADGSVGEGMPDIPLHEPRSYSANAPPADADADLGEGPKSA